MTFAGTARSIVLSSLIAAVLYMSGLLVLVTPLPLIYVSAARGRWAGFAAAALSLAAVCAIYLALYPSGGAAAASGLATYLPIPGEGLAGFMQHGSLRVIGIGYFAFYVAVALALGEGARFRWSVSRWGGIGLLAGGCVIAAVSSWLLASGGSAILQGIDAYVKFVVNQIVEANAASGAASTQAALLADHADEVTAFILQMMPSLVSVFAIFAVVVNLVIGRRLIKNHHPFSHVHNVARFRLPDVMVWAVIAAGVSFFGDRYAAHTGWLSLVALNCIIVLGALYFFQGLAVTVYLLQGIRFPLLRTLAYVAMIIFLQAASVMLVLLGVADVWVDFRLRRWRALHHQS